MNIMEFTISGISYINLIISFVIFILTMTKSRKFNTVFFTFLSVILLIASISCLFMTNSKNINSFLVGYRLYIITVLYMPVFLYLFIKDLFNKKETSMKVVGLHLIIPSIFTMAYLISTEGISVSSMHMLGYEDIINIHIYDVFVFNSLIQKVFSIIYIIIYDVLMIKILMKVIISKNDFMKKIALMMLITIVLPYTFYFMGNIFMRNDFIRTFNVIGLFGMQLIILYGMFHFKMLNTTPLNEDIIINSLKQAFLSIDSSGRIVDCNNSARKLFKGDLDKKILPIGINEVNNFPVEFYESEDKVYNKCMLMDDKKRCYRLTKTDVDNKSVTGILIYETTEYEELVKKYQKSSSIDHLTGILNRRSFYDEIGEALKDKNLKVASVFIFDLDFFKKVNDKYGHSCGDYVLKEVVNMTLDLLSDKDIICRYGGEEFCVFFPDKDKKEAIKAAKLISATIAHNNFYYDDYTFNISISGGVAEVEFLDIENLDIYLKEADENLYYVKNNGRNNIR